MRLAPYGALFLDEVAEFSRSVSDPAARFVLVAAMNPCPCFWPKRSGRGDSRADMEEIAKYLHAIKWREDI